SVEQPLVLAPFRTPADGQVMAVLEFHVDTAPDPAAPDAVACLEPLQQQAAAGAVQRTVGHVDEVVRHVVHAGLRSQVRAWSHVRRRATRGEAVTGAPRRTASVTESTSSSTGAAYVPSGARVWPAG